MRYLFIIAHVFILTFYACAMGSKSKWLYAPRSPEKTPWGWCNPKLIAQVKSVKLDPNTRDYACQRYCAERNNLGKCKEYDVRVRKWGDDKFYHGNWLIYPR